jgi:hypothetical protein
MLSPTALSVKTRQTVKGAREKSQQYLMEENSVTQSQQLIDRTAKGMALEHVYESVAHENL